VELLQVPQLHYLEEEEELEEEELEEADPVELQFNSASVVWEAVFSKQTHIRVP